MLTGEALEADSEALAPAGSLRDGAPTVSFTPLGDDLAPVFDTVDDLDHQAVVDADVLERAGLEPGDHVHTNRTGRRRAHQSNRATTCATPSAITPSERASPSTVLWRNWGTEVILAGHGDSEAAAGTIQAGDVDALSGTRATR